MSGTVQYVATISIIVTLVFALRRRPLPAVIAYAGATSAVVHLSGGLIRVGEHVLYNSTPGPELLRHDHFGHSLGTAVGALVLWEVFMKDVYALTRRSSLIVVTALAALVLGAINEVIEFIATLAQNGGGNAGGYDNTGWDMVTNTIAGVVAGMLIHRYMLPGPVPISQADPTGPALRAAPTGAALPTTGAEEPVEMSDGAEVADRATPAGA